MKWILDRNRFLNEAKIRDVIFSKQAKEVIRTWGEKYLDYEEITPTDKIKQGKWKLSEEDKLNVLGHFFDCDMNNILKTFTDLPDRFASVLSQSINTELTSDKDKYSRVLKDFNVKKPSIDQIVAMYDSVFRKLNITETMATEMIQKDENGRPIRGEDGQMMKTAKAAGDPIFTNNLISVSQFVDDYNRCFPDEKADASSLRNEDIQSLRNLAKEDCNNKLKVDFEIFNRDIYLAISHNPKDILNMSISKFYNSCQNLYDGGYRTQLLSNVFDPNSIPAFLVFETPIFWGDEKIAEQLPLSRMVVRNIETFDNNVTKTFYDRAYPDRMKDVFDEIVTKYSGNQDTAKNERGIKYVYTPDVELNDTGIKDPYMDRLDIKKMPYIGVNTKTLYLSRLTSWKDVKIAPNAKIKELVIETTDIPANLLDIKLDLDWVKFKYLTINDLSSFNNIKSNSIAFDKCKFDGSILKDIKNVNKLQIIASDVKDLDLSSFEKLDELHLLYTLENGEELKRTLGDLKVGKLVISGDLASSKEDKLFINSLRQKGAKVEIQGPVI
jgi:hypothetical protein